MSDPTPAAPNAASSSAAPARRTGLSPKEQKLQALRDKAARAGTGAKHASGTTAAGFQGKTNFAGKKTAFQRKAT